MNRYKVVLVTSKGQVEYQVFAKSIYDAELVGKIKAKETNSRFLSAAVRYGWGEY